MRFHKSNNPIEVIAYNVLVLAAMAGTLPELSCQSGVTESPLAKLSKDNYCYQRIDKNVGHNS